MFTYKHQNVIVKVRAGQDRQAGSKSVYNITVRVDGDIIYRRRVIGSDSAPHYLAEEALQYLIHPVRDLKTVQALVAAFLGVLDLNKCHYSQAQQDRRSVYGEVLKQRYSVEG